jgi:hypothetical protein
MVRLVAKPDAKGQRRIAKDHRGKRRPPAIAVGGSAEDESANRAHGESQHHGNGNRRDLGVELHGDVPEHEHHQEEIERVQHPAEIGGDNDALLFLGPAGQRCDGHASPFP